MSIIPTETSAPSATSRAAASRSSLNSWLSKGFLALVDQGLFAGSNFLLSLVLARVLLPEEYGAYALAFEALLLLAAVYGALILEPLSVFAPSVYRDCPEGYFGGLLRIHLALASAAMLVFGTLAWWVYEFGKWDSLPQALAGAVVAAPCAPLFWLARRAFYTKLAPLAATVGSIVYCMAILGGLTVAIRLGFLSPFLAFVLIAAGALVTSAFLLFQLRPSLKRRAMDPSWLQIGRQHWEYGRWALASAVVMWMPGSMYYLLLGKFHGLSATAALKALLNLASPVGHIFVAFSLLSLPYASAVHHQDDSTGVRQLAWRLTALYAAGAAAYWLFVVLFRRPILDFLYAGKYAGVAPLIPWVALGSVLRITATAQVIPLRARQSPSLVFVAYGLSSAVAVLVGGPATWAFGLRGAVVGEVLANAAAFGVAFILLRRSLGRATVATAC